jgi:transposase
VLKYKLYPTKAQRKLLGETTFICSMVYNQLLAECKEAYESPGTSFSCEVEAQPLPATGRTVGIDLMGNHHLAKSIADSSWSTFTNILAFKAEEAGRQVVKVTQRTRHNSAPLAERLYR